jgi:hypothetical protein
VGAWGIDYGGAGVQGAGEDIEELVDLSGLQNMV